MAITISLHDGKIEVNGSEDELKRCHRNKGKSLLKIPADYTVLDIETTGFNPQYDSIIEVCCIKYRNNKEIGRFSSLIQPLPLDEVVNDKDYKLNEDLSYADNVAYVSKLIAGLTGINSEMLSDAPTFDSIADDLWSFLRGELIVGHNIHFDINFLYDNFLGFNSDYILQNDFVDTLRLSRIALPKLESHRLEYLDCHFDLLSRIALPKLESHRLEDLDRYFDLNIVHHRAEGDCLITYSLLQELSKIISENNIDLEKKVCYNIDARYIKPETNDFDTDNPLYDKNCVFTGKLERFVRKDAAQIVVNLGGHCENNVTKKTNFLIVGDFDYCNSVKEGKSSKLRKAEQLILNGQDLQIITEKTFCDMLIDYIE